MSHIDEALKMAVRTIEGLIHDYRDELDETYLRLDSGEKLKVGFTVEIEPAGHREGTGAVNNGCVSIGFVKERVRDKTHFESVEGQMGLFDRDERGNGLGGAQGDGEESPD